MLNGGETEGEQGWLPWSMIIPGPVSPRRFNRKARLIRGWAEEGEIGGKENCALGEKFREKGQSSGTCGIS